MKARNVKSAKIIEVWEITKTGARPDWVVSAFENNYFVWADGRLRIKMAFIHPSAVHNFETGLAGGAGGYVSGFGDLLLAEDGDFVDYSEGKIISANDFQKKYEIL